MSIFPTVLGFVEPLNGAQVMLHPTSHFQFNNSYSFVTKGGSFLRHNDKFTYFYLCSMGKKVHTNPIFSKLIPEEEEKKVYRVLFSNFNKQALYVQKGGFIYFICASITSSLYFILFFSFLRPPCMDDLP